MKKILKSLTVAIFLISITAGAGFAWNPKEEVQRLGKDIPSMDTFGNPQAVIWLKNQEMRLNQDNSVDNFKYTVVYFGDRIPADWREHKVVAPVDGDTRILLAAIFNPVTGVQESTLKTEFATLPGGCKVYTVHVPDTARKKVIVLVEAERRIGQENVDVTVSMAEPYPVWEQKIAVQMTQDKPLYWFANKMREPDILKSENGRIYFWSVTNQPAWHGDGIRIFQRPFISFSASPKLSTVLAKMQEKAELYRKVELPSSAPMSADRLINWLEAPERNETQLPKNAIRPLNMLPKEGPWTPAERTLLLNACFNRQGRGTKIWWQAPTTVMADSSVAEDFWSSPVIVNAAGKKSTYYQAGQGVEYGDVSPLLAGTDIYRFADKKSEAAADDSGKAKKKKKISDYGYETREVKAGSPADHRLSLSWSLRITPDGAADGSLSAIIDGAWAGLFSGGSLPTKDVAVQLLTRRINLAIPGMILTPTDVKMRPSGYKLDFKVHCALGIVQNRNMLLRLPGGIPEILGQLLYDNDSVTFRFPFMIDQHVRIDMPKGYKSFTKDINNVIGTKKSSQLVEKITYNPARTVLEADCKWIVKKLKQEMDDAQVLKQQIGAFLAWPSLNLPFRK